ncbi:MAG: hypothetical protein DYG89_17430 [Caldilinea sp. CFX5]|nr:hypothetical protein [Caldilinea sp. CFX5]
MLPENTILGTLTIVEIYEFYNMPVLFACRNRTGQFFLAEWIDETTDENIWLYVPVSAERFAAVRQGKIDLHSAFVHPEDIFVFKVSVSKQLNHSAVVEATHIENLDIDWAPLPGEYLDIPNSLPQVVWENVDQRLLTHA